MEPSCVFCQVNAPLCARSDGSCDNEDPFIWEDTRGTLHMLMHSVSPSGGFSCPPGCLVGSHAFYSATNGSWVFSRTVAYNTTVAWDDGTTEVLNRCVCALFL